MAGDPKELEEMRTFLPRATLTSKAEVLVLMRGLGTYSTPTARLFLKAPSASLT